MFLTTGLAIMTFGFYVTLYGIFFLSQEDFKKYFHILKCKAILLYYLFMVKDK